jgi:predicted transcriptional regulator
MITLYLESISAYLSEVLSPSAGPSDIGAYYMSGLRNAYAAGYYASMADKDTTHMISAIEEELSIKERRLAEIRAQMWELEAQLLLTEQDCEALRSLKTVAVTHGAPTDIRPGLPD